MQLIVWLASRIIGCGECILPVIYNSTILSLGQGHHSHQFLYWSLLRVSTVPITLIEYSSYSLTFINGYHGYWKWRPYNISCRVLARDCCPISATSNKQQQMRPASGTSFVSCARQPSNINIKANNSKRHMKMSMCESWPPTLFP